MKKSYSALIQPSGSEITQFATISTDGQVLLWDKKFLDPQKKPITDVILMKFSIQWYLHGRLAMDSTFLGLKEEVQWVALKLPLIKMKSRLFLLEQVTKENCLFAIGQLVQLTKLAAKMTLLSDTGIRIDHIDQ